MKSFILAITAFSSPLMLSPAVATGTEYSVAPVTSQESTTISFAPNSSVMSTEDYNELRSFVNRLKETDEVHEEIVVAVWSDSTYPANALDKEPTDQEQELAEERAETVAKTLDTMAYDHYEILDMSTPPGWLAKLLGNDEEQIKGFYSQANEPGSAANKAIANRLKEQGGPAKAVVTIRREY